MTACALLLTCAVPPAAAQPYPALPCPTARSPRRCARRAPSSRAPGTRSWWPSCALRSRARTRRARCPRLSGAWRQPSPRRSARASRRTLLALRRRWNPRQCARRIAAARGRGSGHRGPARQALGRIRQPLPRHARRLPRAGRAAARGLGAGERRLDLVPGRRLQARDSLYRLALAARRAVGDSALVGRALNSSASIAMLHAGATPRRAISTSRRAPCAPAIGDRAGLAATLNYLGLVAVRLGERDSARVWYEQALDLAVARGDSANVAEVLGNYACLLGDAGERARGRCASARSASRARGTRLDEASLQYPRRPAAPPGPLHRGRAGLQTARALNEVAGTSRELMMALNSLGRVWNNLQDPARALPPLERAVALADSLGYMLAERSLNDLAIALRLAGDEREATGAPCAPATRPSRPATRRSCTTFASTLGLIAACDRGDLPPARAWLERASRANPGPRPSARTSDLIDQGHVATEEGRAGRRGGLLSAGPRSGRALRLPDPLWLAMIGMGGRGRAPRPLHRRRWPGPPGRHAHRHPARPPARGARLDRAVLGAALRLRGAHPPAGQAGRALPRQRLRGRGVPLGRAGPGARLPRPGAGLRRQRRGRHAARARAARALLALGPRGLLEYSLGDSSSSLWVVTRRAWRRITLPPRPALRARAEILRRGLADPASADARATRTAARALYRALVEPAEPLLKGVTHLVVAPDGPLALVPFEALLARDVPGDGALAPGRLPRRALRGLVHALGHGARHARRPPAAAAASWRARRPALRARLRRDARGPPTAALRAAAEHGGRGRGAARSRGRARRSRR